MADGTEGAAPATGGGGGGGKLVVPLLAVNSLLVAGVLALVLLRGRGGTDAAAHDAGSHGEQAAAGAHGGKAPPLPLPGPTLKLPDFVIHLRDADADRYARMSFEVEVGTEEDKSRVTAYLPQIRDGFIAYLTDLTVEDLRGSESLVKTKQVLTEKLSSIARGTDVKALYITDFVVQ